MTILIIYFQTQFHLIFKNLVIIKSWGTKWDPCEVELFENSMNKIEITFKTAWSPPIEWIKKCFDKYDDVKAVKIYYCECGCDFYGVYKKIDMTKL